MISDSIIEARNLVRQNFKTTKNIRNLPFFADWRTVLIDYVCRFMTVSF